MGTMHYKSTISYEMDLFSREGTVLVSLLQLYIDLCIPTWVFFINLAIEFSSNTGRPFGALKKYIVTFLVNFAGGGRAFSQPLGFLIGYFFIGIFL